MERKPYGFKLTFEGFVTKEEIIDYIKYLKNYLNETSGNFGIVVDMRTMKPLAPESQEALTESQKLVSDRLTRSATVVSDNAIIQMQFKRLSKKSGVADTKRFIDASSDINWEKTAENWIVRAIDPYPVSV